MSIPPKFVYSFNVIQLKSQLTFIFIEISKMILKFIGKCQKPKIVKPP